MGEGWGRQLLEGSQRGESECELQRLCLFGSGFRKRVTRSRWPKCIHPRRENLHRRRKSSWSTPKRAIPVSSEVE